MNNNYKNKIQKNVVFFICFKFSAILELSLQNEYCSFVCSFKKIRMAGLEPPKITKNKESRKILQRKTETKIQLVCLVRSKNAH